MRERRKQTRILLYTSFLNLRNKHLKSSSSSVVWKKISLANEEMEQNRNGSKQAAREVARHINYSQKKSLFSAAMNVIKEIYQ